MRSGAVWPEELGRPEATGGLAKPQQGVAELRQLGVGARDPLREDGDLARALGAWRLAQRRGALLEPPAQPQPLRLDLQHAGVAVGQGALDLIQQRSGRIGQHADIVEDGSTIRGIRGHLTIIQPGAAMLMGRASYLLQW